MIESIKKLINGKGFPFSREEIHKAIISSLAEGPTPEEIAAERQRSKEEIQKHMKQAMGCWSANKS